MNLWCIIPEKEDFTTWLGDKPAWMVRNWLPVGFWVSVTKLILVIPELNLSNRAVVMSDLVISIVAMSMSEFAELMAAIILVLVSSLGLN